VLCENAIGADGVVDTSPTVDLAESDRGARDRGIEPDVRAVINAKTEIDATAAMVWSRQYA
jgi:hypothetical protein